MSEALDKVFGGLMIGMGGSLLLDVVGHPWGELALDAVMGLFAAFVVLYGVAMFAGLRTRGETDE